MVSRPTSLPQPGIPLPVVGHLGVGALSLVLANAGLLLVYFAYDVSLFQLVLVYWCECLWIGISSAIKLFAVSICGDPYENRWASVSPGAAVLASLVVVGLASGVFFSLLGIVLLMILWAGEQLPLSLPGEDYFDHVGVVLGASCLLLVGHGISLVGNFFILGEFRNARMIPLATLPFRRCLALFAAIIASFAIVILVPPLESTGGFAAVLIVLKLLWDIRLHMNERSAFSARTADRN